jgi:hypothetical protein
MSIIVIVTSILIYHRHKPIDLICIYVDRNVAFTFILSVVTVAS